MTKFCNFGTILPPSKRSMSLKVIKTQFYICFTKSIVKTKILNSGILCYIHFSKKRPISYKNSYFGGKFRHIWPILTASDRTIFSKFGKMNRIDICHNIWWNWRKRTRQLFFIPFFRKKNTISLYFLYKIDPNYKMAPKFPPRHRDTPFL